MIVNSILTPTQVTDFMLPCRMALHKMFIRELNSCLAKDDFLEVFDFLDICYSLSNLKGDLDLQENCQLAMDTVDITFNNWYTNPSNQVVIHQSVIDTVNKGEYLVKKSTSQQILKASWHKDKRRGKCVQ